ncbi:hypothetical protein HDV00_000354 [Rhizophlyctis rosea]|nr:hypothetical protein HDV00_000354 [Rhizophlyctis rosea]
MVITTEASAVESLQSESARDNAKRVGNGSNRLMHRPKRSAQPHWSAIPPARQPIIVTLCSHTDGSTGPPARANRSRPFPTIKPPTTTRNVGSRRSNTKAVSARAGTIASLCSADRQRVAELIGRLAVAETQKQQLSERVGTLRHEKEELEHALEQKEDENQELAAKHSGWYGPLSSGAAIMKMGILNDIFSILDSATLQKLDHAQELLQKYEKEIDMASADLLSLHDEPLEHRLLNAHASRDDALHNLQAEVSRLTDLLAKQLSRRSTSMPTQNQPNELPPHTDHPHVPIFIPEDAMPPSIRASKHCMNIYAQTSFTSETNAGSREGIPVSHAFNAGTQTDTLQPVPLSINTAVVKDHIPTEEPSPPLPQIAPQPARRTSDPMYDADSVPSLSLDTTSVDSFLAPSTLQTILRNLLGAEEKEGRKEVKQVVERLLSRARDREVSKDSTESSSREQKDEGHAKGVMSGGLGSETSLLRSEDEGLGTEKEMEGGRKAADAGVANTTKSTRKEQKRDTTCPRCQAPMETSHHKKPHTRDKDTDDTTSTTSSLSEPSTASPLAKAYNHLHAAYPGHLRPICPMCVPTCPECASQQHHSHSHRGVGGTSYAGSKHLHPPQSHTHPSNTTTTTTPSFYPTTTTTTTTTKSLQKPSPKDHTPPTTNIDTSSSRVGPTAATTMTSTSNSHSHSRSRLIPTDSSYLFANDTSMIKPLAEVVRDLEGLEDVRGGGKGWRGEVGGGGGKNDDDDDLELMDVISSLNGYNGL